MTRFVYRPLVGSTPRGTDPHIFAPGPDTSTDAIDWVAVERAANNDYDPMLLNLDEKREASILMSRAGYGERQISIQLCVYARQVTRWKVAAGLATPKRQCDVDGCDKPHFTKGLCTTHNNQARRAARQAKEAA